jgi:hypothetical protein
VLTRSPVLYVPGLTGVTSADILFLINLFWKPSLVWS